MTDDDIRRLAAAVRRAINRGCDELSLPLVFVRELIQDAERGRFVQELAAGAMSAAVEKTLRKLEATA